MRRKTSSVSALEHLWIYNREPSDMAEKGEPHIFVSGKGCQVTDIFGETYIDAMSGWWLKNVGYGRTEIADAAYEQMLQLTFMPSGSTAPSTIKLAQKIADITPGDLSRCFFTSGGSESVETALKLCRAYHRRQGEQGRYRFISRMGSYHGATFGAMALGGSPIIPRDDYEPLMPGSVHVPPAQSLQVPAGGGPHPPSAQRGAPTPSKKPSSFTDPRPLQGSSPNPYPAPRESSFPGTSTGRGSGRYAPNTACC